MLGVLEGILWLIRFLFGACIFSCLCVVADRMPRKESIVKGRSHCTVCGHVLTPAELIPCVSYLCLRGRCRACGAGIPVREFLCETVGGAAFVLCAVHYGFGVTGLISLEGAVVFCYLGILLAVALIDWETQMIYNRFHILILLLAVVQWVLVPEHGLPDRLLGAVIVSVPMLALTLLVPGAFGGGDIKLMVVTGLFLGTASTVVAMFLSLVAGGGFAAGMLLAKKMEKTDQFAFGPFLAFGLAVAALWGDQIAGWYLSLL